MDKERQLIAAVLEEFVHSGNRACSGCGLSIIYRMGLKALGKNTILVVPPSCLTVLQGLYPVASTKIPCVNVTFASTGAATGILLNMLGFAWVDPVAGAVVALIVAKTGMDILRESSSDLMDNVPSEEIAGRIHEILDHVDEIQSIEDIHAHRFGPYLVVNLTIGIDGDLSVKDGDKIADIVEHSLISGVEMLRKVYVHYHPTHIKEGED